MSFSTWPLELRTEMPIVGVMRNIFLAVGILVFCAGAGSLSAAGGGESASCSLDWTNMDINTEVTLNLKALRISLPSGRGRAEEQVFSEYLAKVRPFIYSIPVNSSAVLGDFVASGELASEVIDSLALDAVSVPPVISADMQDISASYRINLSKICSVLATHEHAADFPYIARVRPAPAYTGIIIIANEELEVHGRNIKKRLNPCLFPRIWDTEMTLVFDKKFTNPEIYSHSTMVHYMGSDHIFIRTPSGLSPEIEKIVGNKPLRILAREIFGINATDLVIDGNDALLILSEEANKRLLREGRFAIIAPDSVLTTNLQ